MYIMAFKNSETSKLYFALPNAIFYLQRSRDDTSFHACDFPSNGEDGQRSAFKGRCHMALAFHYIPSVPHFICISRLLRAHLADLRSRYAYIM